MNKSGTSPGIALRERLVAIFAALTLVASAWAFGGILTWALHLLLAFGLLTLFFALVPLPASWNGRDGEHSNTASLRRLIKAPFFWLWLGFLGYICLQAVNPAGEIARNERGWWVQMVSPPLGKSLPSSIDTDYEPMNAWRMWHMFLAAFAVAFAVWGSIRRRLVARGLLWVFVVSGTIMAVVGIIQHVTGEQKVLWSIQSANHFPWGSFFYRNQAAAYLNIVLTASCFLYFYEAKLCRDKARSSGPHFLLFLFCLVIYASVVMALSRGGILIASLILASFLLLVLLQFCLSVFSAGRSILLTLIMVVLFSGGGYLAYSLVDWEAVEARFGEFEETFENADREDRVLSSKATWEMAQDRLWLGWGGGSFRYIFPMYQNEYPEIWYRWNHSRRGWEGRRFYRYAHNDVLQFLAEYGIIGSSLLWLGFLAAFAAAAWRWLPEMAFATIILSIGTLALLAHSVVDFIFHSPAVWMAFVGLVALGCTLTRLENARVR